MNTTTTSSQLCLCYFHIIIHHDCAFLTLLGVWVSSKDQHSETYQANDYLGSPCAIYLLAQLTQIANEGFSKAKEEWRRICCYGVRIFLVLHPFFFPSLLLLFFSYLDKRQDKLRTEAAEASTGTGSAGPTRHPIEEMDVDSNGNQPLGVGGATGDRGGR